MATEDRLLERTVARILRGMAAIAAAGAIGLLAYKGWTWAAGFLIGSAASYLNFSWLKQVVEALGGPKPRGRLALILGLRYLLLGGGAYVILKCTPISITALLAGLFVSVAAVIFEILFQLVYARV
jgi:hypothetical protein